MTGGKSLSVGYKIFVSSLSLFVHIYIETKLRNVAVVTVGAVR